MYFVGKLSVGESTFPARIYLSKVARNRFGAHGRLEFHRLQTLIAHGWPFVAANLAIP